MFPRISAVRPLVATPEADGSALVTLWGYNLTGGEESDVVLARSQGEVMLGSPGPAATHHTLSHSWHRLRCSAVRLLEAAPPFSAQALNPISLLVRRCCRAAGKYVQAERVGEVASDPSWGSMQRMQLRVEGAELGALQVEIMRGGFISSSKVRWARVLRGAGLLGLCM